MVDETMPETTMTPGLEWVGSGACFRVIGWFSKSQPINLPQARLTAESHVHGTGLVYKE